MSAVLCSVLKCVHCADKRAATFSTQKLIGHELDARIGATVPASDAGYPITVVGIRRNCPATMCPVVVVVLRIIVVVKMIPAIAVIDVAVPIVVDAVRFVMDTARLFCRRGSNVGRTAEGTSAEGKSVEKPNQTVVGGRARYMAGHTQPLARVLMNKYAIIPKQLS